MVRGWLDQKRQYRQYQERARQLPAGYREAVEALQRYLMYYGAIAKGEVLLAMSEDLLDLFEQSAASRTPIRAIVGPDPVEFAEEFVRNYSEGQWINRERQRLTSVIDRVAADDEDGGTGR